MSSVHHLEQQLAQPRSFTRAHQVTVVITHFRALDELRGCLNTLRNLPYSSDLEVVVADSDALAGAGQLVAEEFPSAYYLPFRYNCGYAALVNASMDITDRPFVFVLNADIRLEADTLPKLLDQMEQHPDVGIIGPAVTYSDGRPQESAFAFYRPATVLYRRTPLGRTRRGQRELQRFRMHDEVEAARGRGGIVDADWLMGAALLVRRSAARDVGPLDESYFLYFEDVDWCLQFWRSGWRVVHDPSAQCVHLWARASAKGGAAAIFTNPLTRRHIRSSVKFFSKYGIHPRRSVVPPIPMQRNASA